MKNLLISLLFGIAVAAQAQTPTPTATPTPTPTPLIFGKIPVSTKMPDEWKISGGKLTESSIKMIDLGIVKAKDVFAAGGILQLLPYTPGRLITAVTFSADGWSAWSTDVLSPFIIFGTPGNVSAQPMAANGFASIVSPGTGTGGKAQDTFSLSNQSLLAGVGGSGVTNDSGGNQSIGQFNGPLYATWGNVNGYVTPFLSEWTPSTPLAPWTTIFRSNKVWTLANDHGNGITGLIEPDWSSAGPTLSDGTLTWSILLDLTGSLDGGGNVIGSVHARAWVIDEPGTVVPYPKTIEFVQQPTNTAAGATITPAITAKVLDQNGDPYTFNSIQVGIWIASGDGTISGTQYRNTDPATGIVTFNDLAIAEAANGYFLVIDATEGCIAVPRADSTPFNVTAP